MSTMSTIRMEKGRVYLIAHPDGSDHRSEAHIVRVGDGMVCFACGIHGHETWESGAKFAKRDPKAIGWVKKGTIFRNPSYVYDPPPDARETAEELQRVEGERRAMREAYCRVNAENADLRGALDAIAASAVRDEKERRWFINDDQLAIHDKMGDARKALPR